MTLRLISLLIGLILGFVGGPVWVLIPWALAGIIFGYFSKNYKEAALSGFFYAFITSFTFLLKGYNGADPVSSKFLGFIFLSLFGSLGGIIAALVGQFIRLRLRKK